MVRYEALSFVCKCAHIVVLMNLVRPARPTPHHVRLSSPEVCPRVRGAFPECSPYELAVKEKRKRNVIRGFLGSGKCEYCSKVTQE